MRTSPFTFSMLLVMLVSCSPALSSIDFGDAASPCDFSEGQVGEHVLVGGLVEFVDDTAPDGLYADVERDGCRIGVWVGAGQFSEWQNTAPEAFKEGSVSKFEGRLTSQPLPDRPDEFQLIVEVDRSPQVLLTSAGEVASAAHSMPACEYPGVQVGGEAETSGEVILKDESAVAGVYLELDSEGCFARVWVERRFWDAWTPAQQAVLVVGNRVTASGIMTVVRGDPTIDISEPAVLSSP